MEADDDWISFKLDGKQDKQKIGINSTVKMIPFLYFCWVNMILWFRCWTNLSFSCHYIKSDIHNQSSKYQELKHTWYSRKKIYMWNKWGKYLNEARGWWNERALKSKEKTWGFTFAHNIFLDLSIHIEDLWRACFQRFARGDLCLSPEYNMLNWSEAGNIAPIVDVILHSTIARYTHYRYSYVLLIKIEDSSDLIQYF